jgi:hypothetical protein
VRPVLVLAALASLAHADPDLRPWKLVPHLIERPASMPRPKRVELDPRGYQLQLAACALRKLGKVGRLATRAGWRLAVGRSVGFALAF